MTSIDWPYICFVATMMVVFICTAIYVTRYDKKHKMEGASDE